MSRHVTSTPPPRVRQARYVHSGKQIACVIRNADALAALAALTKKHGGVTAAITAALLAANN